ncbi:Glycopeptide antibiotics resistance protein [Paenibacillus algorifonticola]|uniref:Glycopeptide antibiotics resistance protein n=1 Tax=Paenibacillus algorifonticola TaxID=684063 RepID=A0A1I2DKX0_9BACL|nr:VanZ family protein [Paenibacillus algorifonticola]SFE81214.1 Glycopeptide antibiotics resistance protein [Paenibacillus algorifonticola]
MKQKEIKTNKWELFIGAAFVVYLFFLFKIILLKWNSIGLDALWYHFKTFLHHPYLIYERQANLKLFDEISRDIDGLSISRFSSSILFTNLIGNTLAFIPFGAFIAELIKSQRVLGIKVFVLSLLLSLFFELSQFFLGIGIFDVDDLLLNTVGGMMGYAAWKIYVVVVKGFQPAAARTLKRTSPT